MKRQLIYHTPVQVEEKDLSTSEAALQSKTGRYVKAHIKTISRDGVSLNCDQHTLQTLLPNTPSVSPKQPVSLDVSFRLRSFLSVCGNVIAIRRLSKDVFQLELRFNELDVESESEINDYIEQSLYNQTRESDFDIKQLHPYSNVA